jgi:Ni/Co efflux regulator RcnB
VAEYHRPRDYHEHKWRKGERLPATYRAKTYVVEDYNVYRLRPPPRGYHWVRVNNDVVLAAIATGAVLEVMNDLFYQ